LVLGEQAAKFLRVGWLDEVVVEPGLAGAGPVLLPAVHGQGDQQHRELLLLA
jgi:hypothetical protein